VLVTFGSTGTATISVTVTNACTTSPGVTATLDINVEEACNPAAISSIEPSNGQAVIVGSTPAVLRVNPNGNPSDFTYQWYQGGSMIGGATSQSYSATLSNTYKCVVQAKCGGAVANSDDFNVTVATIPDDSSIGIGSVSGRMCFDINEGGNNNTNSCGTTADRNANKVNFATASDYIYKFTNTHAGNITNVRYAIVDPDRVLASTQALSGSLVASMSAGGTVNLTLKFKSDLNTSNSPQIKGRTRNNAAKVTLNIIYNNGIKDLKLPLTLKIQDCSCCGAKVNASDWKEFMCYNLGVADNEIADPFAPSAAINSSYYQWGKATNAWTNNSTSGYYGQDNSTFNNSNDTKKSPTDPCPTGYRVPSANELQGAMNNNTRTNIPATNWTNSTTCTNCWSGTKFGPALFLPSAGYRFANDGRMDYFGKSGNYWSTHKTSNSTAHYMYFVSDGLVSNFYDRAA
jgi:uncharacterized protein (TIGR02145 family)